MTTDLIPERVYRVIPQDGKPIIIQYNIDPTRKFHFTTKPPITFNNLIN